MNGLSAVVGVKRLGLELTDFFSARELPLFDLAKEVSREEAGLRRVEEDTVDVSFVAGEFEDELAIGG